MLWLTLEEDWLIETLFELLDFVTEIDWLTDEEETERLIELEDLVIEMEIEAEIELEETLFEELDFVIEIELEEMLSSSELKQTAIIAPSSLSHSYTNCSTPAPSEIP